MQSPLDIPNVLKWTPFKAVRKSEDGKLGHIEGILSSDRRDKAGDRVCQKSLVCDELVEGGFIKYEHIPGALSIVGHVTSVSTVELPDETLATTFKGVLYLGVDDDGEPTFGQEIWDTQTLIQKSTSDRSLGCSIEGKYDPTKRTDEWMRNVHVTDLVITPAPVNPDSWWRAKMASLLRTVHRSEGMGYPTHGEAAAGEGSLDKVAVQSLQGAPSNAATPGLSPGDLLVARLLKEFPTLTWVQGEALAEHVKQANQS